MSRDLINKTILETIFGYYLFTLKIINKQKNNYTVCNAFRLQGIYFKIEERKKHAVTEE